jgi:hypothetical protein
MSPSSTLSALTWLSAAVCCWGVASAPAWAGATVYRCGQTYQDRPCEGAQALSVDDSRDADQRAQAKQVAASEKRLAKNLADERRSREKFTQPQTRAAGIPLPKSAIPDPQPDSPSDCGKDGKAHAKSKKSKGAGTLCGDAKVRYAVQPGDTAKTGAP